MGDFEGQERGEWRHSEQIVSSRQQQAQKRVGTKENENENVLFLEEAEQSIYNQSRLTVGKCSWAATDKGRTQASFGSFRVCLPKQTNKKGCQ